MAAAPLLTIATVTFNAREAFAKTLASVAAQTRRAHVEYLVIDGGSTDGTAQAIQEAAASGRVSAWVSEADQGIYDAMNKAAARAQGDYLLFLNAGDTLPESMTLEAVLDALAEGPNFLWGDCIQMTAKGLVPDPAPKMVAHLHRQMTVSHQSLYVRTALLRQHPFDLAYRVTADYEVLCWLVTQGHQGRYLPCTLSVIQAEGFSSRYFFQGLREKKQISSRYFPKKRLAARFYFAIWGSYVWAKTMGRTLLRKN